MCINGVPIFNFYYFSISLSFPFIHLSTISSYQLTFLLRLQIKFFFRIIIDNIIYYYTVEQNYNLCTIAICHADTIVLYICIVLTSQYHSSASIFNKKILNKIKICSLNKKFNLTLFYLEFFILFRFFFGKHRFFLFDLVFFNSNKFLYQISFFLQHEFFI